MVRDVMRDAEGRMKGSLAALEEDLHTFRTGRASPHLLDRIEVEMYGQAMPLNQLAAISVPEPQQLAVKPYDPRSLSAIEKAILKSDLGIMPNSDGKLIRLTLPRLTEERRRDLNKMVHRRAEEAKVALRNVRRDALTHLRRVLDDKEISEDQFRDAQDDLQKLTDRYIDKVDDLGRQKSAEIMEV
jgi:ribosome recycling factor